MTHDDHCCMEGAWPGWGPHPDCPGVEALNESYNRAVEVGRQRAAELLAASDDENWLGI
jgi:hypothetical protein